MEHVFSSLNNTCTLTKYNTYIFQDKEYLGIGISVTFKDQHTHTVTTAIIVVMETENAGEKQYLQNQLSGSFYPPYFV
jgi:hypothetical protein